MLEEVQSLCRDTFKLWVRHPTTLAGHPQARWRVPNETKPNPRIPKLWDKTLRCRRICVRGNGRIHSLALLASRIPDDAGRITDAAGRIPDAVSKLQNAKLRIPNFKRCRLGTFADPRQIPKTPFWILRIFHNLPAESGAVLLNYNESIMNL